MGQETVGLVRIQLTSSSLRTRTRSVSWALIERCTLPRRAHRSWRCRYCVSASRICRSRPWFSGRMRKRWFRNRPGRASACRGTSEHPMTFLACRKTLGVLYCRESRNSGCIGWGLDAAPCWWRGGSPRRCWSKHALNSLIGFLRCCCSRRYYWTWRTVSWRVFSVFEATFWLRRRNRPGNC